MKRVGIAGHIYYISFGEGELVGHVATCDICDVDLDCNPNLFREIHAKKLAPAELAALTNAQWRQRHALRLEVEQQLKSAFGKISPEHRQVLLEEPFVLLAPKVEARFSASQFDLPTFLAFIGACVSVTIAVALSEKVPEPMEAPMLLLGGLVAIGLIVWQMLQIKHRYFRDKIFPTLVPALRPLKPSVAEIEDIVRRMKSRGAKIGEKLDPKRLLAALAAPREA